jgi:hypothetical protein
MDNNMIGEEINDDEYEPSEEGFLNKNIRIIFFNY